MRRDGPAMTDRRQAVLGAAALVVAAATGASLLRERSAPAPTVAIPSAPGFLRLDGAASMSGAAALTAGIDGARDGGRDEDGADLPPLSGADLCAALFHGTGPGLPVAAFTDYYCPSCPALAPLLADPALPPLSVTWHEWPILGPRSEFAARVALAAASRLPAAEGHDRVHSALMRRRPRPSRDGAAAAARALGLDPGAVLAALQSDETDARLRATARAARQLGLTGTPSLVIGRVVVSGLPAARTLRQLARAEAAALGSGGFPCQRTG